MNEFERRQQLGWHVSIRVDNIAHNLPDLVIYAGGHEASTRAFYRDYYVWANQRTDVTKVMLNNGLVEVDYVYMTAPHKSEDMRPALSLPVTPLETNMLAVLYGVYVETEPDEDENTQQKRMELAVKLSHFETLVQEAKPEHAVLAVSEGYKDNEMACSACGATVSVARVPENGVYRYWYNCQVCEHGENVEQVPEAIVAYLEKREQKDALWLSDVFDGVEF